MDIFVTVMMVAMILLVVIVGAAIFLQQTGNHIELRDKLQFVQEESKKRRNPDTLRRERVAFVGDVLFAGSIGRTDLPGGDHELLLAGIRRKLWPLGDDVKIFSGHGPVTTLGAERRSNPFLQS